MTVRQVQPATVRRVTLSTLGRMACVHGDPADDTHDHGECLLDDEAYAADLILRLIFATSLRDDDATLGRLSDLTDALAPE